MRQAISRRCKTRRALAGLALALLLGLNACAVETEPGKATSDNAARAQSDATATAPVIATPRVTSPSASTSAMQPVPGSTTDTTPAVTQAPAAPRAVTLPMAQRSGSPGNTAPGKLDLSCNSASDCVVKNIGSCCGYSPGCVNQASPTFPEQVKAACRASHTSSTCGFPSNPGCACVEHRCVTSHRPGAGGAVE